MASNQTQPIIASIVRHGLTLLAGYLVARGVVSPTASSGFVEGLTGVLVGLIGFGWSLVRAGKLGNQAKFILALLEQLSASVPVSMVVTNGNAVVSSNEPAEMKTGVVLSDKPAEIKSGVKPWLSPWPATVSK